MSRDYRRSRPSLARWGWSSALGLLCLALAACGAATAAQAPKTAPSATPAARTGYAPTVTATPYAPTPPYTFAGTWTNAPGMPLAGNGDSPAYAFAPSDGRVGYLCSPANGHLYMTRDGGASWSQLHLSATTGCGDVFIDAHDASDLFVSTASVAQTNGFPTSYDLWRSRDTGATWSKLGGVQKPTDPRLAWSQLAVVGSRLLAAM
ncbi:MAG: WD40/YVTN/BNR-like repeat-containing protein, partial [Ktedonobacterales bacterium]